MTLGEQLKKLRQERELSQPELSALVGIEQSYLSKLENDKSVPSNEIFQKILTSLSLTLDQFLAMFDLHDSKKQLIQIPMIDAWFKQQQQLNMVNQRKYLYICSTLIVVAVTLFFIGFSKLVFHEIKYQYNSRGIVLAGEPNDIFHEWSSLIDGSNDKEYRKNRAKKKIEMAMRQDKSQLLEDVNQGAYFVVQVNGGKRLYYFDQNQNVKHAGNAWLMILGVLLFSAGIMGFVLERRLYKL